MFDIYDVILEVYIDNNLSNRQLIKAPKEILMIQFINNMEQIENDPRPIKIKMIRQEVIWDKFEQKQKVLNNEIEYSNMASIRKEE